MAAGWFPRLAHKLMAVLSTHQQQPLHAMAHLAWQRLVRLSRSTPVVSGLRSIPSKLKQQEPTTTGSSGTQQRVTSTAGDPEPEQLLFRSSHLVFKEQYLQLSTSLLEGAALYGLGETVQREGLQLKRDGRVVTLWATDIGSNTPDTGLYGAHPFYLQVQPSE
jgi:alpha-glucosidase (family GH31 glycosyl hydrolase)